MTSSTSLPTRTLGRTKRVVSALGLGGQASLMVPPKGVSPVEIINKAIRLGVSYFDTANVYGQSQLHIGESFRQNGLVPGLENYDKNLREKVFVASKTHVRTCRTPVGEKFPSSFSQGKDVVTAVDDVRRSLTQIFGDGKGSYPQGAYLDCVQVHNLTSFEEVDMVFEGYRDPTTSGEWIGAIAGLRDLRDGTNFSGTNPNLERLIRHIGISGHYSSPTLMYAVQRDEDRVIDTVLVAMNPTDPNFLAHRDNIIPVAKKAGMGVIAMKVFTEGTYYGKPPVWLTKSSQVYLEVGSPKLPSDILIKYALSIPGVDICLTGIGMINDDPSKCQLESNIAATNYEKPLSKSQREEIEIGLVHQGLKNSNSYFQRPFIGLTPPRNVGAELDPYGFSPAIRNPLPAVQISWDSAYAGRSPINHYDVMRDGRKIASVKHRPQLSRKRFVYRDVFRSNSLAAQSHHYSVSSVDLAGRSAKSQEIFVPGIHELDSSIATTKMTWRQSMQVQETKSYPVTGIPSRIIASGKSSGMAFFSSEAVAQVSVQWSVELTDGSGFHKTYTHYAFEDNSTFLICGEGETLAAPDEETALFQGGFEFLTGSGRFTGIRGRGTYSGKRFSRLDNMAAVFLDYSAEYV